MSRKSQATFEFLSIIVFLTMITAVFSVVARDRLSEAKDEKNYQRMEDLVSYVQNEISIAQSSATGYERTFAVPEYLGNENYSIQLEYGYVTVEIAERSSIRAVQNVSGNLRKGQNIISNKHGSVNIN
jgi:hypothetical protein